MTNSFYMVCRRPFNAQSVTAPKHRYATLAEARDAARKLASETGTPHLVLAPVETIHPTDTATPSLF